MARSVQVRIGYRVLRTASSSSQRGRITNRHTTVAVKPAIIEATAAYTRVGLYQNRPTMNGTTIDGENTHEGTVTSLGLTWTFGGANIGRTARRIGSKAPSASGDD